MALTTYNITGNLEDALGAKATLGEVTFMPAGTTQDARVDGADAMLGPIRYSLADLPSPMPLTEGAWIITIRATGRVNGEAQFRTKTIPWNMTAATTWGAIVASAADPVPLPAPTFDESVAGVLGTGGQTDAALKETIGSQARFNLSGLHDFVAKCEQATTDVKLLVLSDSTAATSGAWVDKAVPMLAARFPHLNISHAKWTDGSPGSYAAPVVTAGTGTKTLHIYNASVAGKTWQYHFAASRWAPMLLTPDPDAVVISLGHNDNPGALQSNVWTKQRAKAVAYIEWMRTLLPAASVVLMSQNPLLDKNVSSENRANMYRTLARQRGYGFIDVCKAFNDDPRPLTDLVSADNTHPTDAGYTVWAERFMTDLDIDPTGQVTAQSPSSFAVNLRNLLADPTFANFDGTTTPAGMTLTNTAISKDTTNYETGTWGFKMSKVAGGSASFVQFDVTGLPASQLRGRTITFAARIRVASTTGTTSAQASIYQNSGVEGSETWGDINDQFHWRTVTVRIASDATFVRIRLYPDPTSGSTLYDLTCDRWGVWVGDLPSEVYPSV